MAGKEKTSVSLKIIELENSFDNVVDNIYLNHRKGLLDEIEEITGERNEQLADAAELLMLKKIMHEDNYKYVVRTKEENPENPELFGRAFTTNIAINSFAKSMREFEEPSETSKKNKNLMHRFVIYSAGIFSSIVLSKEESEIAKDYLNLKKAVKDKDDISAFGLIHKSGIYKTIVSDYQSYFPDDDAEEVLIPYFKKIESFREANKKLEKEKIQKIIEEVLKSTTTGRKLFKKTTLF